MTGPRHPRRSGPFGLRLPILWIMLGVLLATPPFAAARPAVLDIETAGRRLDLGGAASFIAGSGDERFVFGSVQGAATQLSVMDLATDASAEVVRLRLAFPIADGQVDFSGKRLVAVGNRDGRTWIASVELGPSGRIVERPLPMVLANPLVTIDAAGVAKVADAGLGRIFTLDRNLFDDAVSEARVVKSQFFDSAGGVGSLHVTADGQFGFVGDHASTRLSILDANGRALDTLTAPVAANNASRATLPATVSFHDGSLGVSAPASLLMADYPSETLRVVDFEPVLQALSVTATASIALPIKPGSVLPADRVGSAPASPMLLGASADEGTIAVGNRFSTTVLFFSRAGNVLERIGSATTARLPDRLLVSRAGRTVVVSYPGASFVTVVRLAAPEAAAQGGAHLDPGGSTEMRHIQKALGELGYPIVVDGYAGPRTMQSLEAVRQKTGRGIDLTKPADALETLRSIRTSLEENMQ